MALPATTVWELRTTGTAGNLNGGGFNSARGGTDYTLQNGAQLNPTDLTTSGAGSTTLTTSGFTFTSLMVGNIIHITAGTNFQTGWYEIVTFTDASNVVLDRTPSSGGAGSVGVGYVGGALSMNSTLDDALFESFVAGNIVYVKAGTFSLGQSIALASTVGTITANIHWLGYNATRGDDPTGTSRPVFNVAANAITLAQNWTIRNLIFTGTANTVCVFAGNDVRLANIKVTNTQATAGKVAVSLSGTGSTAFNCEFICQNGTALSLGGGNLIFGCYIHDSDTGLTATANTLVTVMFTIFENNKTVDWTTSATTARLHGINNTFYGLESKQGIGFQSSGVTAGNIRLLNNIFYGKTTAISIGTVQQDSIIEDYNTFYNNTTDRTLCGTGAHSVATNPSFVGATQLTGTTATTSGSVLTDSGANFSTVEDNVDFLRVVSGTGVTVAVYLITSHTSTTLTVNNALGTSGAGNVVYSVGTGHDFSITGSI